MTFRPRKIRKVCWLLAPAVLAVFAVLATALTGSTGAGQGVFQRSDQVAMIGLGVLAAGAILAFTRPKVTADAVGVKIQNVIGGYSLPWEVVRAVRFERGNPWVTLELQDDDVVAVMAIQAADKEYAVAGARALRRLLAAHGPAPKDAAGGDASAAESVASEPAAAEGAASEPATPGTASETPAAHRRPRSANDGPA